MPTLRRFGGRWVTSWSLMTMVPVVGVSNPATMRKVVVLPQPLGPRNETNSPRVTSRLKSATAIASLNDLEMFVRAEKRHGFVPFANC